MASFLIVLNKSNNEIKSILDLKGLIGQDNAINQAYTDLNNSYGIFVDDLLLAKRTLLSINPNIDTVVIDSIISEGYTDWDVSNRKIRFNITLSVAEELAEINDTVPGKILKYIKQSSSLKIVGKGAIKQIYANWIKKDHYEILLLLGVNIELRSDLSHLELNDTTGRYEPV